ncbi:methyltransferase domain-containing protein [Shimia ponticola]|uniref:methyltransferase domain-containing protein n=1 Tax=Shimia ponticola TaxID=2582893 RepID=UPI0011BE549A|nr:methyltransferase domain-containing protein [Shimia ponticola]
MHDYSSMFEAHDKGRERRTRVARNLASLLIKYHQPKSVIDLGCGMGFFLSAMKVHGADIHGVDGPWVADLDCAVDDSVYTIHDLNAPYRTEKRYEMASSLEVAEHLNAERSDDFVAELTALSDYVLFSAAIPGQKGAGHINCQWQGNWAERFASHGYRCFDPFRRQLFAMEEMAIWFKQNLLFFVKDGAPVSDLLAEHEIMPEAATYVLPKFYNKRVNHLVKQLARTRGELRTTQKALSEAEDRLAEQGPLSKGIAAE